MRINWIHVCTGGAIVVLGVASLVVGGATVWAVSGLIGLPPLMAAALLAAALVTTVAFARMVHSVEPFFEPTPPRPTRSGDASRGDARPQ